ncbi:unnamed protein product [Amoebophrya sp. A120]|nr:unnamed protein product [Amoebophrya sp. A120]|eukprot:GSA120T00004336001.1
MTSSSEDRIKDAGNTKDFCGRCTSTSASGEGAASTSPRRCGFRREEIEQGHDFSRATTAASSTTSTPRPPSSEPSSFKAHEDHARTCSAEVEVSSLSENAKKSSNVVLAPEEQGDYVNSNHQNRDDKTKSTGMMDGNAGDEFDGLFDNLDMSELEDGGVDKKLKNDNSEQLRPGKKVVQNPALQQASLVQGGGAASSSSTATIGRPLPGSTAAVVNVAAAAPLGVGSSTGVLGQQVVLSANAKRPGTTSATTFVPPQRGAGVAVPVANPLPAHLVQHPQLAVPAGARQPVPTMQMKMGFGMQQPFAANPGTGAFAGSGALGAGGPAAVPGAVLTSQGALLVPPASVVAGVGAAASSSKVPAVLGVGGAVPSTSLSNGQGGMEDLHREDPQEPLHQWRPVFRDDIAISTGQFIVRSQKVRTKEDLSTNTQQKIANEKAEFRANAVDDGGNVKMQDAGTGAVAPNAATEEHEVDHCGAPWYLSRLANWRIVQKIHASSKVGASTIAKMEIHAKMKPELEKKPEENLHFPDAHAESEEIRESSYLTALPVFHTNLTQENCRKTAFEAEVEDHPNYQWEQRQLELVNGVQTLQWQMQEAQRRALLAQQEANRKKQQLVAMNPSLGPVLFPGVLAKGANSSSAPPKGKGAQQLPGAYTGAGLQLAAPGAPLPMMQAQTVPVNSFGFGPQLLQQASAVAQSGAAYPAGYSAAFQSTTQPRLAAAALKRSAVPLATGSTASSASAAQQPALKRPRISMESVQGAGGQEQLQQNAGTTGTGKKARPTLRIRPKKSVEPEEKKSLFAATAAAGATTSKPPAPSGASSSGAAGGAPSASVLPGGATQLQPPVGSNAAFPKMPPMKSQIAIPQTRELYKSGHYKVTILRTMNETAKLLRSEHDINLTQIPPPKPDEKVVATMPATRHRLVLQQQQELLQQAAEIKGGKKLPKTSSLPSLQRMGSSSQNLSTLGEAAGGANNAGTNNVPSDDEERGSSVVSAGGKLEKAAAASSVNGVGGASSAVTSAAGGNKPLSSSRSDIGGAASSMVSSQTGANKRGKKKGKKLGANGSQIGQYDMYYLREADNDEIRQACYECHMTKPTFSEKNEAAWVKRRIFEDRQWSCKSWVLLDRTNEVRAAMTCRVNHCRPLTEEERDNLPLVARGNKWETETNPFYWIQIMNMSALVEGQGDGNRMYKVMENLWRREGFKIVTLYPADNDAAPKYWGNLGFKEYKGHLTMLPMRAKEGPHADLVAEMDVGTGQILPLWEKDLQKRTMARRGNVNRSLFDGRAGY